MQIRIENIYYLLAYAWEFWADGEVVDVRALRAPDSTNLLALLLNAGTRRAIRRGLHQDYQTIEEDIKGIRGRVHLGESERRTLFARGLARCTFDDLNHASLPNRIIKSTLQRLVAAEHLDETIRDDIGTTLRELRPIPTVTLNGDAFRKVRSRRSNAHYELLLSICELVFATEIPSEDPGKTRFRDFCEDEVFMHDLFEEFVRNFYQAHALEKGLTCMGSKKIAWNVTHAEGTSEGLLPAMKTDVSLENPTRHLIVDCKFYPEALAGRFSPKLRSEHLYQLWTYVSQQQKAEDWRECEGLLLYPAAGIDLNVECWFDNQRMRAATVDLGDDWRAIRERLLTLLD